MKKKTIATICLLAINMSLAPQFAAAENDNLVDAQLAGAEDVGAPERINFSGRLRMLSQRIATSACHLSLGIEGETSQKQLTADVAEYDKILNALEFGDEDLGIIGPESRRKTLVKINALKEQWAIIKVAAEGLAADANSSSDLDVLMTQNLELLKRAAILVTELTKAYSNPRDMLMAHSMLIDVSGRQRMLSQKMSKEACILATTDDKEATKESLEKTMNLFQVSLEALRFGMPMVGINPPPTEEIAQGLQLVQDNWDGVKPLLLEISEGADGNMETQADKRERLNTTLYNMNQVVIKYAKFAADF